MVLWLIDGLPSNPSVSYQISGCVLGGVSMRCPSLFSSITTVTNRALAGHLGSIRHAPLQKRVVVQLPWLVGEIVQYLDAIVLKSVIARSFD